MKRAEARVAYEAAEQVMAARAEQRGAEPSDNLEHFFWAEVEAPMLFDSTEAHREEMEEITLTDIHACCAHVRDDLGREKLYVNMMFVLSDGDGELHSPTRIPRGTRLRSRRRRAARYAEKS